MRMGLFGKKKHSQFNAGKTENREKLHKNLDFTASEQYKLIRANLEFTLPENEKCPVIGVTSAMRGEGKSTTAINLSYVLAEKGSRVLLIDADLRIPSIAKKLDIESTPGLSDILIGKSVDMEGFKSNIADNWYILPSGEIPPNPSELLSSNRMKTALDKFKEDFDYIVIDLPPVNIVSDAVSASSLLSGMIVVIREELTAKKELERCIRQLKLSNVNILGCVMNAVKPGKGYYGKYKKYKYYKYYKYYRYYRDYRSTPKGNDNK